MGPAGGGGPGSGGRAGQADEGGDEVARFRAYLAPLVGKVALSVPHQRLRDEQGLRASWATFYRYAQAEWPEQLRKQPRVTIRLNDPPPGEEARVYGDADGESHFEDVTVPMQAVDFAPPAPPISVSAFAPAAVYGFIGSPPGWEGDWHPMPHRQIIFYLTGEIEAETSDSEVRRFGPGSITLVEDTTGKGHRSRVVGPADVMLAVVQLPD